MAEKHQRWHYWLGIPGAVSVPLSTATFFVETVPTVASLLALAGAVLASLTGFLGEGALAKHHWRRHACLEGLVQKYENAARGPEEPSNATMDQLATEWTRCTGHPESPASTVEGAAAD
jgi:hypothetical protein